MQIVSSDPASRNIHPETKRFLSRTDKEQLLKQTGRVFWLYGLSGSGKSTIANLFERALHSEGRFTLILDGDNLRTGLNANLGFSDEDRAENVRRVAETARLLASAGIIVIVSVITPRAELRDAARRIIGDDFHEVYVKAAFGTCALRDPKGLYAKASSGAVPSFTGRDSAFEPPTGDCVILDTETASAEECAARLLQLHRTLEGRPIPAA